ncbi:hypothetical protein FOMG_05548 [Fusarium oxysporum f. sp. melonis 26406]|uniref:Uncharacterized protein n=1 Tax=Fusarium oxysporum f. sp. melonis 26406 TaxID=1089452 RepID=X0APG4_FUSOX|nr:hypothetical protein FOMG_05548 [Fusarium oxysporum f. sp. melonis 26406]
MPSANPVQKQLALDLPVLTPGLPDFGEMGLNRALPLAQSQHWTPTSQKLHVERLKETKQPRATQISAEIPPVKNLDTLVQALGHLGSMALTPAAKAV